MTRCYSFLIPLFACLYSVFALADSKAYQQPFPNISATEKQAFYLGQSMFERLWVPAPSSTTASDGLGPHFNARSCHSCHVNSGRGHAPTTDQLGSDVPSFFIRLGNSDKAAPDRVIGDYMYGRQFHPLSATNVKTEGDYRIHWQESIETFDDGSQVTLRNPSLEWLSLNHGDFQETTGFSMRVSPPLVGMGLLDLVPDSLILENADPDDLDQNGISGKANWIERDDDRLLGRFGHKASVSSLNEQNQSAFNGDLGLSTELFPFPSGDCTVAQTDCMQAPNGNSQHLDGLEVSKEQMAVLDTYVALSMPPAMRNLDQAWFKDAKQIFDQLECGSCHIPKLTTGLSKFTTLSHRDFYPFTDMLLHDLGSELANGFPVFNASPQEWRTAPLWGIGLSESVSGRNGFLHDGRARTIEEAILWHGGEAQASKKAYKSLNAKQRALFVRFLESL
ncbi:di-heme oxidoreductase family protein [Marinomonas atlantica]|uniref:di-heme oxidoreductase family protein n=1 Tax=Marinomonas atlantica TaxID=1806668 RepID=UPI00082CC422|nr:di-heme oxidoredictase family protein [Marinomonas atlantica]